MTGNYLEVGKGLPYRKNCFQNYIGNNFDQDGIVEREIHNNDREKDVEEKECVQD